MATKPSPNAFPIKANDALNINARNTYGQLRDYGALQTLPDRPAGSDSTGGFDWYSATPSSGQRTAGLLPATAFGGLQDSRYLPAYAIPTGPGGAGQTVNHIDAEMARGIPDQTRYNEYDRLRTMQGNVDTNLDYLNSRADRATGNGRQVPGNVATAIGQKQPVSDYLSDTLGQYLQNQQQPAVGADYFNAVRTSEQSRQANKKRG